MGFTWSCKYCDHLDMSRKEWGENKYCYRYGCNARKADGYICFWCLKDSDLKSGGCSNHRHTEVNEQLSLF